MSVLAEKTGPAPTGPSRRTETNTCHHDTTPGPARQAARCARCGRGLTDPASVVRGLGPLCYRASGGGIFDADLQADQAEWDRREQLLRGGGEVDFGVTWQYLDHDPNLALQVPMAMRVSLRHVGGQYEAYGAIFDPRGQYEVVFLRAVDLRTAYAAAVQAGPASTAAVHRMRRGKR